MEEYLSKPLDVKDTSKYFRHWYTRDDWGAHRPRFTEPPRGPVSKVYLHFNTRTPSCYGADECVPALRALQEEQIRKEMNDIAYNFIVTSGGNIYVGRGFGVLPSASLRYAYGDRLDIAFFGRWTLDSLPFNMFKSSMIVVELGLEQGYIKSELEVEPIIPKAKVPKEEAQMKRFLNREQNKKKKKPKKVPGRRRNFHGKEHVRQWTGF